MLAYLFSRYPVVSQTFCDSELLALEGAGVPVVVGSLNPPPDSFRHPRLDRLGAEVVYPPPPQVLKALPEADPGDWAALAPLVAEHDARYGPSFKAETRARNALYFAREFRRRGVRHVHIHFANRATHTALFLKCLGLPFSFTAHAKDFMVDLGSDDLLRELCREAEFVVAVSDFSRGLLAGTCPDSDHKIFRIYNGVSPGEFNPAAPGASPGRFRVVSVGRLVGFKGFPDLVEATVALRREGVPAELTIIGDGPERGSIEEQVARGGAGEYVHLLGSLGQDAVREQLERADAFALACTTDREGGTDILPTVIIEAMATGLPVVSTRIAGVPEMIEDGKTGFLVAPGAPDELAEALGRLHREPGLAARMGEAGRQLAAERFETAKNVAELRECFGAAADPPGEPVRGPGFAYLIGRWPAEGSLVGEVAGVVERRIPVLAMGIGPGSEGFQTSGVEFLPDGVVVEASWRRAAARFPAIDELRRDLGTSIDGEEFYLAARRAVYLCETLPKRGIAAVHAARSDTMVVAWLAARLGGFRATFAAERRPSISRSLIARIAPDFADASVADAPLAEQLPGSPVDVLGLASPAPKRRGRFWGRRTDPGGPEAAPPGLAVWLDRLSRANG